MRTEPGLSRRGAAASLLVVAFAALVRAGDGPSADPDARLKRYLDSKARFAAELAKHPGDAEDDAFRRRLQSLLSDALGAPASPDGKGLELQPETLQNEMGADCLDGLSYAAPAESWVLLSDTRLTRARFGTERLSDLPGRSLDRVVCGGVRHIPVRTVDGTAPGRYDEVLAVASLMGDDVFPGPPNELSVFARLGTRVLVVTSPLPKGTVASPRCEKLVDDWRTRAATAAPESAAGLQERAVKASVQCYREELAVGQNGRKILSSVGTALKDWDFVLRPGR